ncbi:MAG: 1-deoxy-D-xylulose-5-phosphate reductoisomerase [Clostridia bacterium]|nr:1-deoxy-D-xylulose-5-phosphate reductoisomerase [Clostridia bacterium]
MKKIALIGSTGSIGRQTLNVVRRHFDKFKIVSLAAGNNTALFCEQVKEFKPLVATCALSVDERQKGTEYFFGENAFIDAIVESADIVVVALVGFKGIIAVLDAIKKGKDIALANKESLVVGGDLVMKLARERGVNVYPIDSEHSAIWQAMGFDFNKPVKRVILTCSGGAFRDYNESMLKTATAKDALKHPNWNMGAKITVDCATLVNKGFEVIEAHHLYGLPFSKIDVIIHKESIIHSMVEMDDSSVIAQMSYPSMEIPIQLALDKTVRLNSRVKSLDFAELKSLTFEKPDVKRFPCLDLVVKAGMSGGGYPAVVNGANEAAVKLFLDGKIKYTDIYEGLKGALDGYKNESIVDLEGYSKANAFGENYINKKFGE